MCSQVLMRPACSEMPFCSYTRAISTMSGFHPQSHLWYVAELFMYYLTGIQKKCITEGFAGCHLCIHNKQKKVGINFKWEEQRTILWVQISFSTLILYTWAIFWNTQKWQLLHPSYDEHCRCKGSTQLLYLASSFIWSIDIFLDFQ